MSEQHDQEGEVDELEERPEGVCGVTGCEDVIIENEACEPSPQSHGEDFEALALRNEF